ncbi:hypothetical protein FHS85_003264 [Rhodoligotrophos appendicifer]
MSRAFVKEPDGEDVFQELPDRPVSPHPNLVTARGLGLIEAEISIARGRRSSSRSRPKVGHCRNLSGSSLLDRAAQQRSARPDAG